MRQPQRSTRHIAHLLQHVFWEVLLLIHRQNCSLDLLVGEFQPGRWKGRRVIPSLVIGRGAGAFPYAPRQHEQLHSQPAAPLLITLYSMLQRRMCEKHGRPMVCQGTAMSTSGPAVNGGVKPHQPTPSPCATGSHPLFYSFLCKYCKWCIIHVLNDFSM